SAAISCRITVDDELKDERTSNGVNAQTFCLVKSA
ncbi:MmpS family protein, partial [Mycolicibacterium neworleansense]